MSYRNDADLHLRYGELQVYDDKSESLTNSPTQLVAAINDFAVNNTHLAEKLKEFLVITFKIKIIVILKLDSAEHCV